MAYYLRWSGAETSLRFFNVEITTKKQNIMPKGTIGVTTNNIFPVIKKFLYSDHEIFLRELVSNAVDAT